jgi:hypothetical protein
LIKSKCEKGPSDNIFCRLGAFESTFVNWNCPILINPKANHHPGLLVPAMGAHRNLLLSKEVAAVAALLKGADLLALVFDPLQVDNTEGVKAVEAVEATTLEAVTKKMTFCECSLLPILARIYLPFPQDPLLNFYAF